MGSGGMRRPVPPLPGCGSALTALDSSDSFCRSSPGTRQMSRHWSAPCTSRRRRTGGRRRYGDREVPAAIIFVATTGCTRSQAPPIHGKRGRPLRRPRDLYADRGYDHEVYRDKVRRFQITPHPAPRPARHRARLRPGRVPLGRGRSDRAAVLVPLPAYPLGDPRRHPPRVRHPRLRRHLLAATAHRTMSRVRAGDAPQGMACSMRQNAFVAVGPAQPHIRDLSTSTSQPGANGSKPCSISQRTASRLRNDHHARITSRSMSVP